MAHPGEELLKQALHGMTMHAHSSAVNPDDVDLPDEAWPYAAIPIGSAIGAKTTTPNGDIVKNTILGGLTGAGALAGGYAGHNLTEGSDKLPAMLAGGAVGGIGSLLASRTLMDMLIPSRKRPHSQKYAASPTIEALRQVKVESDRRNWSAKHKALRDMIDKYPKDFKLDSEDGSIVGVTHKSGFRFHMPRQVVPSTWLDAQRQGPPAQPAKLQFDVQPLGAGY
jgi:hypothetical protein